MSRADTTFSLARGDGPWDAHAAMARPHPRPRTVLHVLGGATGGAARTTLELMVALKAEGVRSVVACSDFGEEAVRAALDEVTEGKVHHLPLYWWNRKIRVPAWKRPLVELRQRARTGHGVLSAARVAALAAREGVDLVHTNTSLTPEGGRAARLLGLPHVWHVRELIGPDQPFRFPLEDAALGRYFVRHASVLVANSGHTAACLAPWLPADRLRVVPNGLDLSRFEPHPLRPADRAPVVAMVASLSSRVKKHALFLDLVERLPSSIEARIYGDIPSGDAYASGLVARAGGRVRLMGHVADPVAIMREVDVLVQPSDQDSFGRVVVEAMAAGLPVVGVRGGGVSEIVVDGETGLLVPIDDGAALAAAVARVTADPAWAHALGEAGRARAIERYSVEACVASILDVYADAMARPVRRLG